jgi:hypothetical protein
LVPGRPDSRHSFRLANYSSLNRRSATSDSQNSDHGIEYRKRPSTGARLEWLCHKCRVILQWMSHRILALVAVLALLSAPAAILAGTSECAPAACTGMCCARHAHNAGAHAAEAQCHHSGTQNDASCSGTLRGHIDFGFAAPLPPTILAVTVKVDAPRFASSAIAARRSAILSGFVGDLIKPPRA